MLAKEETSPFRSRFNPVGNLLAKAVTMREVHRHLLSPSRSSCGHAGQGGHKHSSTQTSQSVWVHLLSVAWLMKLQRQQYTDALSVCLVSSHSPIDNLAKGVIKAAMHRNLLCWGLATSQWVTWPKRPQWEQYSDTFLLCTSPATAL